MKVSLKVLSACLLAAIMALAGFAQSQPGKFEQLRPDEIPTPNPYRTGSGAPGPKYWQQRADYAIEVEVNDETQVLTGRETITYYNNAPEALRYLWLQLDQNLFAKNSMATRATAGKVYDSLPAYFLKNSNINVSDYEGGFQIKSVADVEGKPLPYTINETMMRIDLPTPLRTGEKYSFSIAWTYQEYDRMVFTDGRGGYEYFPEDGNYVYAFAQWYPRMCVFDDYEGWQNKQFLGQGEFALTFGNYEVKITVPSDHIVGATGVLQNPRDVLTREQTQRLDKARKTFAKPVFIVTPDEALKKEKQRSRRKSTWVFRAENVRDFAFAHSRKFIWDAMAVRTGSNTPLAMSLYPREGNPLWQEHSTLAVKNALEFYSSRTFDYPYPVAWSVHAADIGMEYPMICFNLGRPNPDGSYSQSTLTRLVSVIVHEVGHNFFPMIVNSDERQWAWMDEGLNTFLEGETIRSRYPELDFQEGLPKSVTSYMRGDPNIMRPIMTSADNVRDAEYGNNAYFKPAAALTILRETVLGEELFDRAFREYANRWAFKHPKPADFFRTMEDVSGVDLDWFWRGWFFGTDHVDLEVADVKWYRVDAGKEDLESRTPKTASALGNPDPQDGFGEGPQPFRLLRTGTQGYGEFRSRIDDDQVLRQLENKNLYEVTLRNVGGLVTPVILEWTYADGSRETEVLPAEVWRLNPEEFTKVFIKEKEVRALVIDPEQKLADVNERNNVFPKRPPSKFDQYKSQAR
ncbi:MAG: M1 family metallopeptidase [Cyclobacteriaceae bacterium]|nr:M1 family metallopeptidase [Cyclobacteriaceae bacterium]